MAEQRRLAAILAADMVGYSRLMEADESRTIARQKAHRTELIDPEITAHNGRIVKTTGDGLLVEFASVVDAVKCAVAVQASMTEREAGVSNDLRIQYRIGINIGDIVVDGDDIFGDGVNVAARIEGLCQPGEVYLSGTAHDHVFGKTDLIFENLGEQNVKNIGKPIPVYRVKPNTESSTKKSSKPSGPIDLSGKPTVAVLPFDNMSGDPEQEYFSDGIAEDIITALSRIRQLFVIARNSTFTYKGQAVDVQAIAKDLGARYVLEGSVRKAGNRVRVSTQLIDGESGNHLWAEKYDRELEDIFAVQDEITMTVVGAIEPELAKAEWKKAKSKPSHNLEAWDYYQRGMSFLWDRDKHGKFKYIENAKNMFEKAIELDSNLSAAYSGLAMCYFFFDLFGHLDDPEKQVEIGLQFARRGRDLDSEDALAWIAMGAIYIRKRETNNALSYLETAIKLDPNNAYAYFWYGRTLVFIGRCKEAIGYLKNAMQLSPRGPEKGPTMAAMAEAYINLNDYEQAVNWAEKALRQPQAQIWGSTALIAALGYLDRTEDAIIATRELLKRKPDFSIAFFEETRPITDAKFMANYVEGLRRAGLPRS